MAFSGGIKMNIGQYIAQKKEKFERNKDIRTRKQIAKLETESKLLEAKNKKLEQLDKIQSRRDDLRAKVSSHSGVRKVLQGLKDARGEIRKELPQNNPWGNADTGTAKVWGASAPSGGGFANSSPGNKFTDSAPKSAFVQQPQSVKRKPARARPKHHRSNNNSRGNNRTIIIRG